MPSEEMIALARQVMGRAYAPYSNFPVGAVLRGRNGKLYAGCNVENAAYPQGVCAEAGALSAMVLAGGTRVAAVAVAGAGEKWVTPCGGCRQKLREFALADTPILMANMERLHATLTMEQLLPHSFGPDTLQTP